MKIKIIDLLNMIAKGEEVPKIIYYQKKYYNLIKKYNDDWEEYKFGYMADGGGYLNIWRFDILNDEVEIIEDKPKKIKKFQVKDNKIIGQWADGSDYWYTLSAPQKVLALKMLEIIDKVNELSKND